MKINLLKLILFISAISLVFSLNNINNINSPIKFLNNNSKRNVINNRMFKINLFNNR